MDPLELAPEVGEPRRIKRKKSPEKAKNLENPAGEPRGCGTMNPTPVRAESPATKLKTSPTCRSNPKPTEVQFFHSFAEAAEFPDREQSLARSAL